MDSLVAIVVVTILDVVRGFLWGLAMTGSMYVVHVMHHFLAPVLSIALVIMVGYCMVPVTSFHNVPILDFVVLVSVHTVLISIMGNAVSITTTNGCISNAIRDYFPSILIMLIVLDMSFMDRTVEAEAPVALLRTSYSFAR